MKYSLLCMFSLFLISSCRSQTKSCSVADASAIDKNEVIFCENGKLKQTSKAIHDTIAIDLHIAIRNQDGHDIEGALVEIISVKSGETDKNGEASFIAFHNGPGTFQIKVSHKDYSCIEINNLSFNSGVIRRLDVMLFK